MIINEKVGDISEFDLKNKIVDYVNFHWYETNKRINHKSSRAGKEIRIKFLNENPNFRNGDVLLIEDNLILVVHIVPCECMVIVPRDLQEMAAACYEIGNRHVPLYFENNELLTAFEKPLYNHFKAMEYQVSNQMRQLLFPLKTTVLPHGENLGLFTKIMQLTNQSR